jgi:hypothetical protein
MIQKCTKSTDKTKKKKSDFIKKDYTNGTLAKKNSEIHNTHEVKEAHQKILHNTKHNQTSPTISKSKIMEILSVAGIYPTVI